MHLRGFTDLVKRRIKRLIRARGWRLEKVDEQEWQFLESPGDERTALPPGAMEALRADNPSLVDLRARYAALSGHPAVAHSRWREAAREAGLPLHHFRGDTLYVWHYRERLRITELKFFIFLTYVRARDPKRVLERLHEDGAFGCWTYDFEGYGLVSRDLLDSANEISFLDRQLGLLGEGGPRRILDVGAGYGRLAYHITQAARDVTDYCCVDAVPESTFLSEYYLRYRGSMPPARVVELSAAAELSPGSFDLVINIHSFPECTHEAVRWWLELIDRLRIPFLFLIPNDGERLLTTEPDGRRQDFQPLLEQAGYKLLVSEPVFADPAVRQLMGIADHFLLFQRDRR